MAEAEDRGFIRDPVADQIDACKSPHRRHLNQRILHCQVAEVIPLLHQVDPQHGLQRVSRTSALAAGLGILGLDQIDESLPGHHSLHLGQKSLPLGAFPRGGLLVITVGEALREALTELLAAHEP